MKSRHLTWILTMIAAAIITSAFAQSPGSETPAPRVGDPTTLADTGRAARKSASAVNAAITVPADADFNVIFNQLESAGKLPKSYRQLDPKKLSAIEGKVMRENLLMRAKRDVAGNLQINLVTLDQNAPRLSASLFELAMQRGAIDADEAKQFPLYVVDPKTKRRTINNAALAHFKANYPEKELPSLLGIGDCPQGSICTVARRLPQNIAASPLDLLRLSDPTRAIVLPGTVAPGAGTPGPLAGNSSLGPLAPGPGGVPPTKPGRRSIGFDPVGFAEVAYVHIGDDQCTGTLIHKEWILTAGHCVPPPNEVIDPKRVRVLLPNATPGALAHCKDVLTSKGSYVRCVDFSEATVVSMRRHDAYAVTVDGGALNDVGLIRIRSSDGVSIFVGSIDFSVDTLERLTVAGYGWTLIDDYTPEGPRIEVGWHDGAVVTNNGELRWIVDTTTSAESGTCFGDSGGPVYRGELYGKSNESHKVVAVVSAGSSKACDKHTVRQTLLSSSVVKDWICTTTAVPLAGCPVGSAVPIAMR
jgi:V8-like Glu-specific endopeptidase